MVHTGMYVCTCMAIHTGVRTRVTLLGWFIHHPSTHPSLEKHFCVGIEEGSMQSLTGIICILQVLFEVIYRWKYNTYICTVYAVCSSKNIPTGTCN